MARSALLVSLLAGLVAAQTPGKTPEVHPKLETFKCSVREGCKKQTNYIVLDSSSHPIRQATNNYGCGDWGNGPNKTACPDEATCAKNCIMEGIEDYSRYGITTNGTSLRMQMIVNGNVASPRVYLLGEDKKTYEMLKLTGNEFTFDVDAKKLPCGMNSALYLSEMHATGARSELNPGGATYGTGYCDAQCFTTPFINGVGNVKARGACCNEMDIWESNSRAAHIAPHPCNQTGLYQCQGVECEFEGVCDKNGCAWNPNRVNVTDYYGRGPGFKVDTTRPFKVVTQFPADANGKLKEIHRLYVQDGWVHEAPFVNKAGLPNVNFPNDQFCNVTGSRRFMDLGAMAGMGDALTRGMVLAMSIWWDEGGNMTWLDSGEAGPCSSTEGNPRNIRLVEPEPEVTYSNMRWGEIGSTF